MNLEGDCRNRHISVFTLVLYKCLLYSYIIFKLKRKLMIEKGRLCASMSKALHLEQTFLIPVPATKEIGICYRRGPCTHTVFLPTRNLSTVSTQVSSKRKESTSYWGE